MSVEITKTPADPRLRVVLPELLAPAGDWECARAAVENGADAIYFGLDRHNARMRANNFTLEALPRLMEYLHRRGVKGVVTLNTLVFAEEMADVEEMLRGIMAAGADAVVVQDVGICRLAREISPDFPIHASTQMTVSSADGVKFARELGCNLVVLSRECAVREIAEVVAEVPAEAELEPGPFPVQVFVHGALCVAYSGQCLTSEALGGRSANRGVCAQACRMPYELVSDGQTVPLGDRRYLLSPQDLAGLELLPDLVRAGVHSIKVEGRLKTAEYVANVTRVYRQALDRLRPEQVATASRAAAPDAPVLAEVEAATRYDLEMAFSRGLYTGWLRGVNNQHLVHGRFGKKRGVYLGEVLRVQGDRVLVRLASALKPGDGLVFDQGRPDQEEQGGRVYGVHTRGQEVALTFGPDAVDFNRLKAGDKIWKTSDPELDRRLRQSFAEGKVHHQRPLHYEVRGAVGQPLTVVAWDDGGCRAEAVSAMPLVEAERQPLEEPKLREQLGRLGGTPFCLGALRIKITGRAMLPLSELNRLRRELVTQVETQRAGGPRYTILPERLTGPDGKWSARMAAERQAGLAETLAQEPQLSVLVRTLPQLEAVLRPGLGTVYCEFEDVKQYRVAVTRFREWQATAPGQAAAQLPGGTGIWVAPPRIFKMGEDWVLKQVRSSEADGYLVRNYDHLSHFAGCRRRGDYSLNVANAFAAEWYIRRHGLEQVTASYDLNIHQLETLLASAPPGWFEITIHQHIPMFHMEHCVFCAFLSQGTDYTNCGRPCDRHEVSLRDRVGLEHPVKADAGCRNTVYNAQAQTGAESVTRLRELGARRFRLEFLTETPAEVERTIDRYQRLLRLELSGEQLWRELKLHNQLGVTRGQMMRE